jgi:hypothetical protein
MYDFLLYLIPLVSKFPRSERFLLGERLELVSFDILELLLEACYSREKSAFLKKANVKLEQARHYVRLCKDLKLINVHRYEVISKTINEIGVQLGGWIRQQKAIT